MKERIAVIGVVVNLFLSISKIIVGILSGSTAVLADGIHSIMDVVSSVIALIGIKISKKPADKDHPYGHYKFEVLSGLFITVILFITGLLILYESFKSFLHPAAINYQLVSLIVMGISSALNDVMARLKIHFGKKENSTSLLSDGVHSRIDVYTSLAVFAGLIFDKYWIYSDSTIAFVIGLFILKESITLGKESADSLVDASAGDEVEDKIKDICKDNGFELIDLKTQKKGPAITVNLKISLPEDINLKDVTKISDSLKSDIMNSIINIEYISIQAEGNETASNYFIPRAFGLNNLSWKSSESRQRLLNGERICVCPQCGYEVEHKRGVPCSTIECPKCGAKMTRKIG
jgi:cation diffusion facilitator family transporter